jgi:uncharacterized protein (TIGR01244 family)
MRVPSETATDNAGLVKESGMAYVNIPVDKAALNARQVDELDESLRRNQGSYLLHCASGARAAMLLSLSRARQHGWTAERTFQEAETMGFDLRSSAEMAAFVRQVMDASSSTSADRVRRSTRKHLNEQIDLQTHRNIKHYANASQRVIRERILELDREWDVERVLEVNASTLALTGLALGLAVNKKWFVLPAAVMGFLLQHGIQGWCPPLPVLRQLGIRTRGEIDREKYALLEVIDR